MGRSRCRERGCTVGFSFIVPLQIGCDVPCSDQRPPIRDIADCGNSEALIAQTGYLSGLEVGGGSLGIYSETAGSRPCPAMDESRDWNA